MGSLRCNADPTQTESHNADPTQTESHNADPTQTDRITQTRRRRIA
jgi:hypothetical protein